MRCRYGWTTTKSAVTIRQPAREVEGRGPKAAQGSLSRRKGSVLALIRRRRATLVAEAMMLAAPERNCRLGGGTEGSAKDR
jgi:hypothetical protein